jgi:hypothetical protein
MKPSILKFSLSADDGTYISAFRPYDCLTSLKVTVGDIKTTTTKTTGFVEVTLSRSLTLKELVAVSQECKQKVVQS